MTQPASGSEGQAAPIQPGTWELANVADSDSEQLKFISFAIGDDQYGVDIMAVREIKGWVDVANLPKQPDYVRGVLNLRGVIVPIVDLRMRFGQGQTSAKPSHVVIIVQIAQRLVGLLADRVLDIVATDAGKIQPVPRISHSARSDFLSGLLTVESGLIALIELSNLLAPADDFGGQEAMQTNSDRADRARPDMN